MRPRTRRRCDWIEQLPSGSHRAWVHAGTDPLTRLELGVREIHPTYGGPDRVRNQP